MSVRKKRYGKGRINLRDIPKNKKAMESVTMIFYYTACLFFAGFVIYTYMKIAYTGAKSTKFSMEFFANDVGLMTDAIYAVPGDVDYDYRKKPSKFVFDFRNSSLYVYPLLYSAAKSNTNTKIEGSGGIKLKESEKGVEEAKIPYASSAGYNYLFGAKNPPIKRFVFPPILSFRKIGSMLEISGTGAFDERDFCLDIDTAADMKNVNIMIDPGHSPDEPGHEAGQKEYQITEAIAESLGVLCRSHSLNCRVLEQKKLDEKLSAMGKEKPVPDMVISIHTGNYNNPDDRPFKAIYLIGSSKSEKLACLVSNQFRKDYIVLEPEQITPYTKTLYGYEKILSKNTPSVIIEVGNIKNLMGFDQASDINEIAARIIKGVEGYYKSIMPEGEEELEEARRIDEEKMKETKLNEYPSEQGEVKIITR